MYKNIYSLIKQNYSFALYRLPNEQNPVLLVGKPDKNKLLHSIVELNDKTGFIIAPFKISEQSPVVCIDTYETYEGERNIHDYLRCITPSQDIEVSHFAHPENNNDYDKYKERYALFYEALRSGKFQKLVLSRAYHHISLPNFSPGELFTKALSLYKNAFVYLYSTPQTGTWFGCSPELLLKGENNNWQTTALAGTRENSANTTKSGWDKKNYFEQQIVSDYIKNAFKKLNISHTQTPPYTIEAGNLLHLKTDFSFQLNNIPIGDLLQILYPTPAICGIPQQEAYGFILKNEGYNRSYYSGFTGYLDRQKRTNLYINLRCMKIHPGKYNTLYAGGGLLEKSNLTSEWQETEAKLQTLLSL